MTGVDFLCEDLLLVTIDACQGRLGRAYAIGYGLMGAELVRLAAAGRITIAEDRVLVSSAAPTGDAELDAALARIGESASPPRPAEWVAWPRLGLLAGYLDRLEAANVIREEIRWWGWVTRYRINDAARVARARQELDAIAGSAGPVDLDQAAYAGLASSIGLDRMLYRGWRRRAERRRLREIAAGHRTASPPGVGDAVATGTVGGQATMAPSASAADQAEKATKAAVSAASQVAINAATQAAINAATLAVAHATAATAHGGHGGGHGGHGAH